MTKRNKIILGSVAAVTLAGVLFFSTYSFGTDRYVHPGAAGCTNGGTNYNPTNGNCSGGGSSLVYTTPQNASNVTNPGDTVYIRAGTYNAGTDASGASQCCVLNIQRSGSLGNPITYRPYASETVIIRDIATQSINNHIQPIQLYQVSYIIIDGFIVERGENALLVYSNSDNNIIRNNIVREGWESGILVYANCDNNLIKGNRVYHNNMVNYPLGSVGNYTPSEAWGSGLNVAANSNNNIVEDNFVYFNHGEGLNAWNKTTGNIIQRNVISDNWATNLYLDTVVNSVTADSNIIYNTAAIKAMSVIGNQDPINTNPIGILIAGETTTADITGVKIWNNIVVSTQAGIWAYPQTNNKAFKNFTIANNTLIRNVNGLTLQGATGTTISGMVIKNNLIRQAASGRLISLYPLDTPPNNTFSSNLYFGTGNAYEYPTPTDFTGWKNATGENSASNANPLIVNDSYVPPQLWDGANPSNALTLPSFATMAANFHISSGSPAQNSGVNDLAAQFSTDYLGTSRPQPIGNQWDRGAHEITGAGPASITLDSPTDPGFSVAVGNNLTISWHSQGVTGNAKIELALNGCAGTYSTSIVNPIAVSNGTYSWTVTGSTSPNSCIKITSLGAGAEFDTSDNAFAIVPASAPGGNVTFNSGSSAKDTTPGDGNLSWTHTTSGLNLALIVACGMRSESSQVSTLTYGGATMTRKWRQVGGTDGFMSLELWYLTGNVPVGGYAVTAQLSSYPVAWACGAMSFNNALQTGDPLGADSHASGASSTSSSVSVATSSANDLVADVLLTLTGRTGHTPGAGQTQQFSMDEGVSVFILGSTKAGTGSPVTMSWTSWSSNSPNMQIGVAVKPATVTATSSITVVSPANGQAFKKDDSIPISWTTTNISGTVDVDITWDDGGTWEQIFNDVPYNSSNLLWIANPPASSLCKIRVVSAGPPITTGTMTGNFRIRGGRAVGVRQ